MTGIRIIESEPVGLSTGGQVLRIESAVLAQGPAGAGAFQYQHTQGSAATVWTIVHNLNGYPQVTAIDGAGGVLWGTVDYVDVNTVTITHTKPYAGSAYLS